MAPDDDQPGTAGGEGRSTRRANPVDQAVGNRVKMRRLMLDMSQEQLGALLGITFQQVQKYEKGSNRVSASRLWQLADVLQVAVGYFFEDVPQLMGGAVAVPGMAEGGSEPYVVELLSTKEGIELVKAFGRITEAKQRKAILDFVKNMAPEEPKDQERTK